MKLIDGDRIVTAQLYDDQHEEFMEKKMSIIDYINAYTDEGVTEADVVEQTEWIPVSERLPEKSVWVLAYCKTKDGYEYQAVLLLGKYNGEWTDCDDFCDEVIAWMPLPKPYKVGE